MKICILQNKEGFEYCMQHVGILISLFGLQDTSQHASTLSPNDECLISISQCGVLLNTVMYKVVVAMKHNNLFIEV